MLREDGSPASQGESGEVVVTGLHNVAMPLFRYRTGDRAVAGGEAGGFPVLTALAGRTQDFLIGRDGGRIPVTGLVFGQHFGCFERISAWKVVQWERGRATVLVVPGKGFGPADEREIRERFAVAGKLEVRVELTGRIDRTPRGKSRFVERTAS